MVRKQFRSRTFRRVYRKTPGGITVLHHVLRKPAKQICGNCGKILSGTLQLRPSKLQKKTKTEKKPSRPYGGVLCSSCMRQKMKERARAL